MPTAVTIEKIIADYGLGLSKDEYHANIPYTNIGPPSMFRCHVKNRTPFRFLKDS